MIALIGAHGSLREFTSLHGQEYRTISIRGALKSSLDVTV